MVQNFNKFNIKRCFTLKLNWAENVLFAKNSQVKLTGKIILSIQILIFATASIGISINFHTCLALGKSVYSINNFDNHGCCNEINITSAKETVIQQACCSNQEQTIHITSLYTVEKVLKLKAVHYLKTITSPILIKTVFFNIQVSPGAIFISPPLLFILQNNFRC